MDVARASGSRHPDAWPHRGAASSAPHRHPIHPWAPYRHPSAPLCTPPTLLTFFKGTLKSPTSKTKFLHQKHFLSKFHPFSITLLFCTHRENIDLADSEKRTPEVKFRPFFIIIPKNQILPKSIFVSAAGGRRADEFGFGLLSRKRTAQTRG